MIAIATQCFGPDLGGIEALMNGLADALAAKGEGLVVFADEPRSREAFARPYQIQRFGFVRPLRRRLKRAAITRASRATALQGIFADSWKSVEAIPPTAAPIAALAHGMELPLEASSRKARRIAAALARCQAIIANSAYTAGLARNFLEGGAPPVLIIPPPIPEQSEPTATALADIDALIAGRGPVLVTLARLEPRKGIDAALRALPAVRRAFPGATYLIAGAGADLARLRALAASLNVAPATHFLGRIDEAHKAALLTRADLFVMPTRRDGNSVEGYGLAYVEAAWRGKPALAGSAGGAADAVVDGETGLLCDGADDEDIRNALMRLLADEALRRRLGAAAAARARSELTWSTALPRYLAAIGL
ncbi:MAG TPA: glycosyltransferase family 4 protein [Roseiarcus sp.]|nr:glycosyltransferase family 4 protein [Roseiarcus sp.]